ncbi:hypothetical protein [Paenibacillus sp. QZ-Y1]|uniref:hypothetical protein n=1 Tax=Paenibacillus sp. QZ-Y1 TaxID=3414511 RepID=UPI003F78BA71
MNVLHIALVILFSFAGLVLVIQGLKKKSPLMLFFGVILILAPILIFMGWITWVPFVNPVALAIAYLGQKKKTTNTA